MRTEAFGAFHADVTGAKFPEASHNVKIDDEQFDRFMTEVDKI